MLPKKAGHILIISFTLLGVLTGFSLQLLESYIEKEVLEILQDEVKESCDCSLLIDEIQVSLLTLRAQARNARIIKESEEKLIVQKLKVRFSLSEIFSKKIKLTKLDLYGVFINEIDNESATFKFIDQLTSPPKDDTKKPFLRIQLIALEVKNGKLKQPFINGNILSSDLTLTLQKNKDDSSTLLPVIKGLRFKEDYNGRSFSLGDLTSEVTLSDSLITIGDIKLDNNKSWAKGEAFITPGTKDLLSGEVDFFVEKDLRVLAPVLTDSIKGTASFSGSLQDPIGKVSLQSVNTKEIVTKKELYARRGILKGELTHRKPNIDLASIRLQDNSANIIFENFITSPIFKIRGQAKETSFNQFSLASPVSYDLKVQNQIAFEIKKTNDKSIKSSGIISFKKGETYLEKLFFNLTQLSIYTKNQQDRKLKKAIEISAEGNLSGRTTFEALEGKATIGISSPAFTAGATLRGQAEIKNGFLTSQVQNVAGTLTQKLRIDTLVKENSKLEIILDDFKASDYDADLECFEGSLHLDYNFSYSQIESGSGKLKLSRIIAGCAPEQTTLEKQHDLTIRNGILNLATIKLVSPNMETAITGIISLKDGYDVDIRGNLLLDTLLPIFPQLDDLSGTVNSKILINGQLDSPTFTGSAQLQNGQALLESAGIDVVNVHASLKLKDKTISVYETEGSINGGKFILSGDIKPFSREISTLNLTFSEAIFDSYQDSVFSLSGDLILERNVQNELYVTGEVKVDNGQIEKNFDLIRLAQEIPTYLLDSQKQIKSEKSKTNSSVALNIAVKAKRNIFVVTNLLGAELAGDFQLKGTLQRPKVEGSIETLSGWFGLKERRFDITSGELTFESASIEPYIEILGETYVRSRVGDNVLILLEARGPISNPIITLSTDRGLSQRELLSLLTSGTDLSSGTFTSRKSQLELEDSLREGGGFWERFIRFFRRITKIDSLSLEPKVNSRRGQIEPALIAQKNILEYLNLIGQSFLSSGGDQASATLQYDLAEQLQLAGTLSTINSENTNIAGIDLKYIIIDKENPFIEYIINGNNFISKRELLSKLKLTSSTKIQSTTVDTIKNTVASYYKENGFLDIQATASCTKQETYCRELDINIDEGPRYKIKSIVFLEDSVSQNIKNTISDLGIERYASKSTEQIVEARMLELLRKDGFIGARIRTHIHDFDEKSKELSITSRIGKPVSFNFVGNTVFSAENFLDTINLFKRKQPFGNNTIKILTQNIERMYREAGYLFATIQYNSEIDNLSNRIYYNITIDEQHKVQVENVEIQSQTLAIEELKKIFKRSVYNSSYQNVFSPQTIVDEEIKRNAQMIKSILEFDGLKGTKVIGSFRLKDDQKTATILYTIIEGNPYPISEIVLKNIPQNTDLQDKPQKPYSTAKINRYINGIINSFSYNGYPGVTLSTEVANNILILDFTLKKQTLIGDITLTGNNKVSKETILDAITFIKGSPFDERMIQESKRELLKLGLFQRVEITQISSNRNRADILLSVVERPLRTLEIGTGLNSEFGYHLFGESIDKSLFKDGKKLTLRLDAYYDPDIEEISRGIASLSFFNPELYEEYSFAQDLRYQRIELTTFEYDLDRYSLSSSLTNNSYEDLSLSLTHTILHEDLDDVTPGAIISPLDRGSVDLSFISLSAALDKRDQVLNPRKGYFTQAEALISSENVLSDASFYSLQGQFSYIKPFTFRSRAFAFAQNIRTGASWTFGDTEQIPITQRYYLGGRTTIRGFRENSLGPKATDNAVIGGDVLMQNNMEFRYYPSDVTSVHIFFDAGNVFLQDRSIDLHDIRTSTGIGIRYLSPIGPIGFDIGHPLNEKEGEPSVRFHFLVGTSF